MNTISNLTRGLFNLFATREPRIEEIPEVIVHTWIVDSREVSLLRKQDQLDCLVINRITNERWRVNPPVDDRPIEERIAHLSGCELIIDSDGLITFTRPIYKWDWNGKEVHLLRSNASLIWQLFDRHMNVRNQMPVDFEKLTPIENRIFYLRNATLDRVGLEKAMSRAQTLRFSNWEEEMLGLEQHGIQKCHWLSRNMEYLYFERGENPKTGNLCLLQKENTLLWRIRHAYWNQIDKAYVRPACWHPINFSEDIPLEDQAAYIKDCVIERVDFLGNQLQKISLRKISVLSQMDGATILDRDNWALTLITVGRSVFGNPTSWFGSGHSEIIIEGVKEGRYFMHLAHFTRPADSPYGEVELLDDETLPVLPSPESIKRYSLGKTETWPRYRDHVQRMLEYVKWQRQMEKEGRYRRTFNLLGTNNSGTDEKYNHHITYREKNFACIEGRIECFDTNREPFLYKGSLNCIRWAIEALSYAGVVLYDKYDDFRLLLNGITTPKMYTDEQLHRKVEKVYVHYSERELQSPAIVRDVRLLDAAIGDKDQLVLDPNPPQPKTPFIDIDQMIASHRKAEEDSCVIL